MPEQPTTYRQFRFRPPPGACDILLIRHGESEPAVEGQPFPFVDGHADPALDPRGEQEAKRVADRLEAEEISAIYVSSLQRTQQTAAPLATRLGLEPVVEPDLREVHLGEWEGGGFRKHMREGHPIVQQIFDEQRWDVIPGAESMASLTTRLRGAFERIAAAHADQRVAVFAHGGVIGVTMHLATGAAPLAFLGADNGSLNHLVITDERWVVRRFNDTGHLLTDLDKPVQPLV